MGVIDPGENPIRKPRWRLLPLEDTTKFVVEAHVNPPCRTSRPRRSAIDRLR